MSRSRYKFKHISRQVWKQNFDVVRFKRWFHFKSVNIFSKNSIILPMYDGRFVDIHKGGSFKKLKINSNHFFKKFGNFIITRKPFFFPIKVKKKKKK